MPRKPNFSKSRISRGFVFILVCLVSSYVSAQTEYVQTWASWIIGENVKVIVRTPSNNAQFIDVATKGDTIRYTPDDLVEYGSRYGKIYVSKKINLGGSSSRVFLSRLVTGEVNLYVYKERNLEAFFLEKQSADGIDFVQITKNDRQQILSDFLRGCESIARPIKIVKYSKKSLTKLIMQYNACEPRPFSYLKFGVALGGGMTKMISSSKFGLALRDTPISFAHEEINATSIEPDLGVVAGLFVDLPLSVIDFSILTGIYYSKNSFETAPPISDAISIEITAIEIPILLKYTLPKKDIRPFLNFGPVFAVHTMNSNGVFSDGVNTIATSFVDDRIFGFSTGVGLTRNVDYRKTMSLEFRFNKFFGNSRSLAKNQANLIFGYTL